MLSEFWAFALSLLVAIVADSTTHGGFKSVPTTVKTFENDTVLLPCYVANSEMPTRVRWLRGGVLLADSGEATLLPTRMKMYENNSLEVSVVKPEDTGEYVCEASRPAPWGHVTQVHAIEVMYPPSIHPIPESGELEVAMGDEVDMACVAKGVPAPVISWRSKGEEVPLIEVRPRLKFHADTRDHAGRYTCVASNGVGQPAIATIDLRVKHKPEIEVKKTWVHASPGIRAQLDCKVIAWPDAKIEWYFNDEKVPYSSRIVKHTARDDHSLIIRNTRTTDYGYYLCRASNSMGASDAVVELSGVANPAIFKQESRSLGKMTYNFIWEVDSYSPIIEYQFWFREFVMTRLVEAKYEALSTVVSRQIDNISYLSLTTDIATVMNSTRSFIVLTGHFIDEPSATMQSFCFGAKQLQPHHTAVHIVEDLEEMTEKFGIDKSKIISVTTDRAANIGAAVRSMLGSSRFHIPCLAHMINLVVQNATDSVAEFIQVRDKVKALVTYFRKSNVAMDDLRAEQRNEGKSEGTFLYPIQDIVTRWNSMFYALERFIAISGYIGKILISSKHRSAPPMLTRAEVDVVRECIAVLKPFERATKELSGEKYVTASMVIPIINCVRGQLNRTSGNSSVAKQLKTQLLEKMNRRMTDLEKVELLALATILDPRFKKLHFQSAVNAANAIHLISQEVRRELISLDEQISSSSNDDSFATDSNDLWSIHDTEAAKNTPEVPSLTGNSIPHELKLYLQQPFLPRTSNPISFWRDSKNAFPGTYKVAMKYLTVLGTSVPSERTVSRLNYVSSDDRTRLTSAHTDMLVFLGSLDNQLWDNS